MSNRFPTTKKTTDQLQVLAIATALLDGKPTKDNAFGRKVEFAMQLVGYLPGKVYVIFIMTGSYNFSYRLRGDQRKKYEDDSTLSR